MIMIRFFFLLMINIYEIKFANLFLSTNKKKSSYVNNIQNITNKITIKNE